MARRGSSEQQTIPAGAPAALSEITSGAGIHIEPVTSMNMDSIELEKFMQEPVVVFVHKTKEKGSLDVITPAVNGVNMPIVRGVATAIKRKYVEALIMSHSVDYEQQINPNSPDQFNMVKKATPSYPFDVIQDTEKGLEWKKRLERSLAQQV
jgi:hypothetical protein